MSDGLQNFLTNLVTHGSISGLLAVTIVDRQGAPIFQVMAPQLSESERNKSHNFLASNRFTSLGAQDATVANERLGEGENRFSVAFCSKYQTVQIIRHPISIIFLANSNANTGLVLKKAKNLDMYFQQLQTNAKAHLESH